MDRARVQSGIQYDRHSDQLDRRNLLELSFGGAISYPLCRAADGLRAGTGSGDLYFRQKSDGSMYMELMPLFYFPDNSLYGASYNFDMAMPEPGVLRLGNIPARSMPTALTRLSWKPRRQGIARCTGRPDFRNGLVRHVEFHIRRKDSDNLWQCKSNPSLVIVGYPEVDR